MPRLEWIGKEKVVNHAKDYLATITAEAESYCIYADRCLPSEDFMARNHIIFKKIPRDIAVLWGGECNMELKSYQEQAIRDLQSFLDFVNQESSLSKAYAAYW